MIQQAPDSLLSGMSIPEFYLILTAVLVTSLIPFVKVPFKVCETFLHEFSHGLATLIGFGKICRIHIDLKGSGYCETIGGIRILTLFSGYIGASTFGVAIFYLGENLYSAYAEPVLYTCMIFIIFASLMWARDIQTFICMYAIGSLFYFPLKHELFMYTSFYLKFVGMYVAINALRAPLHLIDGQSVGDGADLFRKTLIPEGIWIFIWFVYGGICIFQIYSINTWGTLWGF